MHIFSSPHKHLRADLSRCIRTNCCFSEPPLLKYNSVCWSRTKPTLSQFHWMSLFSCQTLLLESNNKRFFTPYYNMATTGNALSSRVVLSPWNLSQCTANRIIISGSNLCKSFIYTPAEEEVNNLKIKYFISCFY